MVDCSDGLPGTFGALASGRTGRPPRQARHRLGRVAASGSLVAGLVSAVVLSTDVASASVSVKVPCTGPSGGAAGLVAAINSANASGGGTISLAGNCAYTLTSPDTDPHTGLPPITSRIQINGGGGTTITRSISAPDFRIFVVNSNGNLTLNSLAVTQGNVTGSGGGIANFGVLRLNDTELSHNTAAVDGGGIDNMKGATATLNATTVFHNAVDDDGGGVDNSNATMILANSMVRDNTASGDSGGILNGGATSVIRIINTSVDDNRASVSGGGVDTEFGKTTIVNTQIIGNSAPGATGGVQNVCGTTTLTNSQVSRNNAANYAGLDNFCSSGDTTLRLVNTTVLNNIASNSGDTKAGGIYNSDSLVLQNSPVTANVARPMGSPCCSTAQGGGIFNDVGASANLTNSPVEFNQAAGASGDGGGIYNNSGRVTLTNSPVINNQPNNCRPRGSVPGCTD